jgi:hypothetical protein
VAVRVDESVRIVLDTPLVKGLGITVEINDVSEFSEQYHRALHMPYKEICNVK